MSEKGGMGGAAGEGVRGTLFPSLLGPGRYREYSENDIPGNDLCFCSRQSF